MQSDELKLGMFFCVVTYPYQRGPFPTIMISNSHSKCKGKYLNSPADICLNKHEFFVTKSSGQQKRIHLLYKGKSITALNHCTKMQLHFIPEVLN